MVERQYIAVAGGLQSGDPNPIQTSADDVSRNRGDVRQLLNDAQFGAYLDYVQMLSEWQRIAAFDAQLGADRLRREQKQALVQVLAADRQALATALRSDRMAAMIRSPRQDADLALLARVSMRTGADFETGEMARSAQLLKAASPLLSTSQHAVLERMETERLAAYRLRLQQFGTGNIYQGPAPPGSAPSRELQAVQQRLRWSISVTVDEDEPQVVTFVGNTGEPISFALRQQLLIEATPRTYENNRLYVDLKAYENNTRGRRFLGTIFSTAQLGVPLDPEQTVIGTVLGGSRGYVFHVRVSGTVQ